MDYEINAWKVAETEFNEELIPRSETIFALGNGYVGVRGALEEQAPVFHAATYINGVYETLPIHYGEKAFGFPDTKQKMITVPDGTGITVTVDNEPFDLRTGTVLLYRRELDFKSGTVHRVVRWKSPGGVEIEVDTTRLVSFSRKQLVCFTWRCTVLNRNATVTITSDVSEKKATNRTDTFDPRAGGDQRINLIEQTAAWDNDIGILSCSTETSRITVVCSLYHVLTVSNKQAGSIKRSKQSRKQSIVEQFNIEAEKGHPIQLGKYLAYAAARSSNPVEAEKSALQAVEQAKGISFEQLAEEQARYLEKFWKAAAVTIEGEETIQQSMRFSLFHLLGSAGSNGSSYIPAKGLTGDGYEGHYFWDAEIYVLPFFSYTMPELAKKLLGFRYQTLEQAKERARLLSHRGALYPWRTIDGNECSAYFLAGTAQYHVNADIIYALEKYFLITGDFELLRDRIAEIVFETARFWTDLGCYVEGKGFCIHGVTGPDEYTALVDNNAYTNIMAEEHLRFACTAAKILEEEASDAFSALSDKLSLTEKEIDEWKQAADNMYVPYDRGRGLYPQDDSFFNKKVWDFKNTSKEKYPLLLHFHPLNIYRHQVLKQPDLVLALFLQSRRFSRAEKKRNFDFYEPLTTGDSSLGPCVQCIMAAELGYTDLAYSYFMKTARMDLDDINGNTADGIHLAALGGTWMSLIYGFAGLRDDDGIMRFSPKLPASWKKLAFRLTTGGTLVEVTMTKDNTEYSLIEGEPVILYHEYTPVHITEEKPVSVSMKPRLEGIIFDLDGVITDTAEYHYQAWKALADELGIPFDREFNQNLRGVGRVDSLKLILGQVDHSYSEDEIFELAQQKNEHYKRLIEHITPDDLLPGIEQLLTDLREVGVKLAVASASRNAPTVIDGLKIGGMFDFIADAAKIVVGKPDPEIFLTSAEKLAVPVRNCVGVEDAEAGITAIREAGMFSVGIGDYLENPHWKLSSTEGLTYEELKERFYSYWENT